MSGRPLTATNQTTGEALRQREEFLRRILESSPDCIKTLNLDGTVLNVTAHHMIGGGTYMIANRTVSAIAGALMLAATASAQEVQQSPKLFGTTATAGEHTVRRDRDARKFREAGPDHRAYRAAHHQLVDLRHP